VSGTTIHSLLQIPVHPPKKNPAPELGGDQLDRLQKDFKGCRMLVIGNLIQSAIVFSLLIQFLFFQMKCP